jgi:hypothetical protein
VLDIDELYLKSFEYSEIPHFSQHHPGVLWLSAFIVGRVFSGELPRRRRLLLLLTLLFCGELAGCRSLLLLLTLLFCGAVCCLLRLPGDLRAGIRKPHLCLSPAPSDFRVISGLSLRDGLAHLVPLRLAS